MFGAALSVSRSFQGLGIGTQLIEHAKRFIVEHDLDGFVGGSRIPFYHQHSEMPVEAYVDRRDDDGNRIPMEVSVGDTVVFAKYSGTTFKTDEGKELLLMKEGDVLAVLA